MRLIDADALKEYIDCGHLRDPGELCFSEIDVVELIDAQTTVEVTDKEDFPEGFFEKPRRQATEEKGFDEKTCIPVTIHYAEPVRHGVWIETEENHGFDDEFRNKALSCSVCRVAFRISDYAQIEDFRYCPNCGARMDEE